MTDGDFNNFDPNDSKDLWVLENIKNIVIDSINKINLDLSNLTVLTEAATGSWSFTPIIAGLAQAESIICITKDSKYGDSTQIIKNFSKLSKYFGIENKIQIHKNLLPATIKKADIITNSGFVRPIEKKFINLLKPTAVISLMWEPWEYREKDLDLSACWKAGIPVLGVDEDNTVLNVMKYTADMTQKILSMHDLKIKDKSVILVGENKSAIYMIRPLKNAGAKLLCISQTIPTEFIRCGENVIGTNLNEKGIQKFLHELELIVINSNPIEDEIIGGKHGLDIQQLKELCPDVKILVYFGSVNYEEIFKAGITCFPSNNVEKGHMGWTFDLLGPRPVIELCSLGLKVGEIMANYRLSGLDMHKTIEKSLSTPYCLDFSLIQKTKYFVD